MNQDLWLALLLMLHFVGVAAVAYLFMLRLLRPERETKCVWLLRLQNASGARDKLYALHMRRELLGERQCVIVALDDDVEEAERRELLRFCDSVPRMYCCKTDALPALLDTLTKNNIT